MTPPVGQRALAPVIQLTESVTQNSGDLTHTAVAYERLRAAERARPYLDYGFRREQLLRLRALIRDHTPALLEAADADFGGRSAITTKIGDLLTLDADLTYMLRHLRGWMRPERRRVALHFQPGKAEVRYQARGVVAVIAPWNYPYLLALGPLAWALAAGNRVLLKPSEQTPRCAQLLQQLLSAAFADDYVGVVTGGAEVARAVCALPVDHVFFTGSGRTAKEVLRAASERLTPVTLELGGKCPVIIHPSYDLEHAAERIIAGKLFNAGQTCMAPDHVWVHAAQLPALRDALRAATKRLYPSLLDNPDYCAIVNSAHLGRLQGLLEDAQRRGAMVEVLNPAGELAAAYPGKLLPVLVSNVSEQMVLAEQEIFGPILPIRGFESVEQVTELLGRQPRPLALYYFDRDTRRCERLLQSTLSGSVCCNDVVLQALQSDLPFGGVGASGMGGYGRAREGFQTFSHCRSVYRQGRPNATGLLVPPYTGWTSRALAWLTR